MISSRQNEQTFRFLLLIIIGYALADPIWDSDFWWHIASGRWIWQSGALPDIDPFGVFGEANQIRNETVLKGQWLGQLILYGVYQLGGANAIVALRVTLLLIGLLLVDARLRQANTSLNARLATLTLLGLCLSGYTGDRPQLFSIFFAALTFWLVDRAEKRQQPRLYMYLPLIALLWANMHGGVILGSVLLLLHALTRLHRSWSDGVGVHQALMPMIGATLFAVATLLTPNGLDAYAYIFNLQGSELQTRTTEYISALKVYQLGQLGLQAGVGFALVMSLIGLIGHLRSAPGISLLIGALLALSIESFRYFAFLLVVATPYVVEGLRNLAGRLPGLSLATGRSLVLTSCIIAANILFVASIQGSSPRGGVNPQRYPVHLTDLDKPLQGRAFNFMNWGGYLLWHTPALLPYIDGRMLDDLRLTPYSHMLWASAQGKIWFEQSAFDWVLIPYVDRFGETYGLNTYLEHDPRWQLHTKKGNTALYEKRP